MNNYLAQAILSSWLSGGVGAGLKINKKLKYSMATCPDPQCKTVLYFPTHEPSVECIGCGQRHPVASLTDRRELSDKEEELQRSITEMKSLYGGKKTPELVKVKGISNYQCKLLSPFLTTHGKDRYDQPRPLKDLGMGEVFDCSKLGSRAFAIESSLLDTVGYGQDKSGSVKYLSDTLSYLKQANDDVQCLVPIHADGDGHCLVHAISRCLVGRELFWHALRTNMQSHLQTHKDKYAEMLKDFYEKEEWPEIINEAGPDYHPPEGQSLGLRTVHIFALANVLRRPIILLDSIAGMQSKGDYSGIYLPSLHTPDECKTRGVLNSPIVIAWSNSGYNHFIPLVPIKDEPLPKLPPHLRPKVWGVDDSLLPLYINIESDDSIVLARGKPLQDTYLQKLVSCMEKLFFDHYGVLPSLVADVNQHVYRSAGCVGVSLDTVIMETKAATEENRLFRCLLCSGITNIPEDWMSKGGTLYSIAAGEYSLENKQKYSFPRYGITAEYNAEKDALVAVDVNCFHCSQVSRRLKGDGTIMYENGDRTQNRADPKYSKCCGFKHYWNGKEYDNLPQIIRLPLAWKGRQKTVEVHWFQNECDPSLNSNIYEVAYQVVSKHFPGEFGSEQLVQQVVEMIVSATENKETEQVEHNDLMETDADQSDTTGDILKTIVSGMNKTTKTLHKEELGASETERGIKRKVEQKIHQKMQQEKSDGNRSGRKTSPTPRDPLTPPTKISATESTSSTKPSPPSPSSLPSGHKKIRVTSSEGKNSHLILTSTSTFTDLQMMIENELGIPPSQQKLRWGFPPKELCPPEDPNSPLALSHGERVSVERINVPAAIPPAKALEAAPISKSPRSSRSAAEGITDHFRSLLKEVDTFSQLQNFPNLFRKGGHCYEELVRSYGSQLKDNMHVQFAEMPDIVFRYNAEEECLEVCLGIEHVPVGPLTSQQKELAHLAAQNNDGSPDRDKKSERTSSDTHSAKWLLNRSNESSHIKAFSGTGRTLGGGDKVSSATNDAIDQLSSYNQSLLQAAQLIVNTRLTDLKQREKELATEVRTLNQKLSEVSREIGSEEDQQYVILERKLLDMSSELKEVRTEISELSNL